MALADGTCSNGHEAISVSKSHSYDVVSACSQTSQGPAQWWAQAV